MKDHYKVLGVPRSATAAQIKHAYRDLIKKFHPDINRMVTAGERTKELNEAWAILSDPEAKMSYDMQAKLGESTQNNSSAKSTTAKANTPKESPKAEPNYCCEKCGREDSTLRMSVFWRVYSLIYFTWKKPFVKILCNKCRVKESLTASAFTMLLGWWSVWGLFGTPLALFKNSLGGEQPNENNAALLNALGFQLYRAKRFHDARDTFNAAAKFKAESGFDEIREYLKHQPHITERRSFWARFRDLQFHPIYYHAPAIAVTVVLVALLFGIYGLNASGNTGPTTYAPSARNTPAIPIGFTPVDEPPVFSEPEQALPEQGVLFSTDAIGNSADTTAPLKITTRYSDGNYVMKIEDWNSGEFVAAYFIRRGGILSIELPLGSYKLKFASGDKWYGWKYLFGPTTTYSYIPEKMDFYISGDYAQGQQIELIPQVGGNLETPAMKATDW